MHPEFKEPVWHIKSIGISLHALVGIFLCSFRMKAGQAELCKGPFYLFLASTFEVVSPFRGSAL